MAKLILSAGMIKAGSAWLFNMTNDLAKFAGWDDVREIRSAFRLQRFMTEANANMGKPSFLKLFLVGYPAFMFGKRYVLKTHHAPTAFVERHLSKGNILATYIYRDPRDVIVSTLDHSQRVRERGVSSAFSPYDSLDKIVPLIREHIGWWKKWSETPGIYIVKYEDLLRDAYGKVEALCRYLQFDLPDEVVAGVVKRYTVSRDKQTNLHFNKGIEGRFRKRLTGEQIKIIEQKFGGEILEMGYSLTG